MTRNQWGTLLLGCMIFFALGILIATVGPTLQSLAQRTAVPLETAGVFFTALFAGSLLTQLSLGSLVARIGIRNILIIGIVLASVGTFAFTATHQFALLLALGLLTGIGHGCVDTTTNLTIALLDEKRSTMALNLVNMLYGVGAVTGPAIAGLAIRGGLPVEIGLWVGGVVLLGALPLVLLLVPKGYKPGGSTTHSTTNILRSPLLWMLGLTVLLVVGIEQGMSGWTASYATQTTTLQEDGGALLSSGFWLSLTFGRLLATALGTRTTPLRLLWLCIGGSLIGGVLLAVGVGSIPLTVVAIVVLGITFGPLFPTLFGIVTNSFRANAGRAAGIFAAMASLGGLSITALQGVALARAGGMGAALFLIVVLLGAAGSLFGVGRLLETRRVPALNEVAGD